MTQGTVLLLGAAAAAASGVEEVVGEFGWSLEAAEELTHLRQRSANRNVVAILFDSGSLSLSPEQALGSLRILYPQALLIPCVRFSEVVNWPELADAGAFHALAVPFSAGEVRQSLAFVWSARLRKSANVVPISRLKRAEGAEARSAAAESVA